MPASRVLVAPALSALLLIAFSAGGCGPTSSGIEGISCSTDSDCNSPLKCLPYRVYGEAGASSDAGCPSIGNECLMPCKADSDCASQGPGLVCLASCGGTAVCEAAADLGSAAGSDALAESSYEGSEGAATDAPLEAEASGD